MFQVHGNSKCTQIYFFISFLHFSWIKHTTISDDGHQQLQLTSRARMRLDMRKIIPKHLQTTIITKVNYLTEVSFPKPSALSHYSQPSGEHGLIMRVEIGAWPWYQGGILMGILRTRFPQNSWAYNKCCWKSVFISHLLHLFWILHILPIDLLDKTIDRDSLSVLFSRIHIRGNSSFS